MLRSRVGEWTEKRPVLSWSVLVCSIAMDRDGCHDPNAALAFHQRSASVTDRAGQWRNGPIDAQNFCDAFAVPEILD
jgi:hypothetical protein